MLINILRDMEAKHLKSAAIYDRDSEEHVILSIEEIKYLIDLPQQNYRILPAEYNHNKLRLIMKTLKLILQCLLEWVILCSVIAIVSFLILKAYSI